jgi:mono/diheme cytochrome c family protein
MCRSRRAVAVAALLVLTTACAQQMANQPRYDPLEASTFFADGQSARQPVPDTVARGRLQAANSPASASLEAFPFPVTREVLERGQQRFDIFCAPCHGQAGYGDGMVVRRGFLPPPSFHDDRLREAPAGHFYGVITDGFGAMPSYADQVPARDRWAIVAYIRALQLSQHAPVTDLPPEVRQQLEREQ